MYQYTRLFPTTDALGETGIFPSSGEFGSPPIKNGTVIVPPPGLSIVTIPATGEGGKPPPAIVA